MIPALSFPVVEEASPRSESFHPQLSFLFLFLSLPTESRGRWGGRLNQVPLFYMVKLGKMNLP